MSLQRKMQRQNKNAAHLKAAMRESRKQFVAQFGREPTAGDPVLWDPDCSTPTAFQPEKLDRLMIDAFIKAGTPGELIHAYQKTGMILTEDNRHLFSREDLAKWDASIDEYLSLQDAEAKH